MQLASKPIDPDPDLVDELRERMDREGYWDIPIEDVREDTGLPQLPWAVSMDDIAESMALLTEAGWPPSFLLMYDEPWVIAAQLKHILLHTLGNRMVFDFAMFREPHLRMRACAVGPDKGLPPPALHVRCGLQSHPRG